ncbi:MAG: type II secretion system protein GspG [Planctomycetes bacterium]|nr:type II secretion system protein GspG [Planctomycetota bacterium]
MIGCLLAAALLQSDDPTPKQMQALVHVGHLTIGAMLYREFNGDLPRSLRALVLRPKDAKVWPDAGFLPWSDVPKDPWGNDYEYDPRGDDFKIWTWGSDGKPGGEGEAADLGRDDVFGKRAKGKAAAALTEARMQALAAAVDLFHLDLGRHPEKLEDVVKRPADMKGWRGPYYAGELADGWGRDFVYRVPGTGGRALDLYSLGPDGKDGTDDDLWHGERPAKKKDEFTFDAWEAWNSFAPGSMVEIEIDTGTVKMLQSKTLDRKEAATIRLKTMIRIRLGDTTSESPGQEDVAKPGPHDWPPKGDCPLCGKPTKDHKDESKWSKETLKVAGRDIECRVWEPAPKNCRGDDNPKMKFWYSREVPGWIVKGDSAGFRMVVVRFEKK